MDDFKSTAENNLIKNIKNIKLQKPFITIEKVQSPVTESGNGMTPQTSVTGTKKGMQPQPQLQEETF